MSHFLNVPINENGIIIDPTMSSELQTVASLPFAFTDAFVYSHGWWNLASSAAAEYNVFSLGFAKMLNVLAAGAGASIPRFSAPFSPLALAVYWPSMLSQNQDSVENFAEATSFFTMEHRADSVGANAGYSLLRLLIEARQAGKKPSLRFNLIGHSFGCRVLCSALQALVTDATTRSAAADLEINLVLLQAAIDSNSLNHGQSYGDVLDCLPKLRILVTTSRNDKALGTWYPAAQRLAHLFTKEIDAMGSAGPTGTLPKPFAPPELLGPGSVPPITAARSVVDLTPLHQSRAGIPGASTTFSGQHSDINLPEIYELLVRFLGT